MFLLSGHIVCDRGYTIEKWLSVFINHVLYQLNLISNKTFYILGVIPYPHLYKLIFQFFQYRICLLQDTSVAIKTVIGPEISRIMNWRQTLWRLKCASTIVKLPAGGLLDCRYVQLSYQINHNTKFILCTEWCFHPNTPLKRTCAYANHIKTAYTNLVFISSFNNIQL